MFDGFCLKGAYYDVFEAIRIEILSEYDKISKEFEFLTHAERLSLSKIAKSDRKWLQIYKLLPQSLASKTYSNLLKSGILKVEKSRETPKLKSYKTQKLKKSERRYVIENKLHFSCHFVRFWFRFIQPNLQLLKDNKFDEVLAIIKGEFDEYASLGFELVMAMLLRYKFNINGEISSFWSKDLEIDLLVKTDKFIIVAEAKYRSKKICKNILNILLKKCDKLKIKPEIIVLFSKSGFSNELLNLKDDRLRLYDLNDVAEMIYE